MKHVNFDNDGQIHHFEGKTPQDACPACHSQFFKVTGPPHQISDSPPIDISPHQLLEVMEQDKPRNQLILNININLIVERSVVNINPK